ncbi:MAG: diadenylate cyclase [Mycoplasmoidaceae bacterium]
MVNQDIIFIIFFIILLLFVIVILFLTIKNYKNSSEYKKRNIGSKNKNENYELIERQNYDFRESLLNTLLRLSEHKIGALIVIENNNDLSYYMQSGYEINGTFSPEFLMSIFSNKKSALHDGAVIIKDRKIVSISSYLPMTKNIVDVKYGARHRAAIGLSEKTDAIIFVVSETNGNISYAIKGQLHILPHNKSDTRDAIEIILAK